MKQVASTGAHAGQDPNNMLEVILLDLRLPKVAGLEVLRQMRDDERTKLLPVIVLTSSNADQDLVDSYHYGANSYIRKPVDFIQLIDAVRQLGLYWVDLNDATRD